MTVTLAPPRTCKNGHEVSGRNAVRVRTTRGTYHYACRTCRREAAYRARDRRNGFAVPLLAPRPVAKKPPPFQTVELFAALPADLRLRVAGLMMDPDPPDAVTAAIVRRVARRRVWSKLGVHFAVIELVTGIAEECRDSTRRVDRILSTILA